MNEDRKGDEAETPTGSVFGNLPRARPGTRSPRRGGGAEAGARTARAESQEPASAGGDERAAEGAEIQGVEDLAWAGVAIAAEAATLGLRLASRAIEAVRGPSES